ncbi:MAG: hypothetical protein R6V62_06970 [Candidatus Fermentibacteraceae bacterium]
MRPLVVILMALVFLSGAALADEEASNRPIVRSSEHGAYYARSIPSGYYGQEGVTRVYHVGAEEDTFLYEFPWYASEMYLGGEGDGTLVRFGPWCRGNEPREDHLAIGFYRDGLVIREYSTLEMATLGSGVSESVSHYEVFGQRLGFRSSSYGFFFEVMGVDEVLFRFDLENGMLLE